MNAISLEFPQQEVKKKDGIFLQLLVMVICECLFFVALPAICRIALMLSQGVK